MQSLFLAAHLFDDAAKGAKRATIRWGERRIEPGLMRYVHEADRARTLTVEVTRVTEMPLRKVADFLGRKREWPDGVLLAGMRRHYPEITLDEIVQVVEHGPPGAA